jgi:hypothetical protein
MERTIKYLYYRGVRYASNLIAKKANTVQELSYRGVKSIINKTQKVLNTSSATKMYRGATY